jgi:hypothetical protein
MVPKDRPGLRRRLSRFRSQLHALSRGTTLSGYPAPPQLIGLPADVFLAVPASGQVVYRLVRKDKAPVDSYRSRMVSGKGSLPRSAPAIDHAGISTFLTVEQAKSRATKYASWVTRLELRQDAGIHIAKTGTAGHYTVWGDPKVLQKMATTVDEAGEEA